jgi:hypothetical protein
MRIDATLLFRGSRVHRRSSAFIRVHRRPILPCFSPPLAPQHPYRQQPSAILTISAPFTRSTHVPTSLPSRLREIFGCACVSKKISVPCGLGTDQAPAQTPARCALAQPRSSSSLGQCQPPVLWTVVAMPPLIRDSFGSPSSAVPGSLWLSWALQRNQRFLWPFSPLDPFFNESSQRSNF